MVPALPARGGRRPGAARWPTPSPAPGSGLALAIDSQDFQSLTTSLGANVYRTVETAWGRLYPHAGVRYTHEFDNDSERVTGRFVNDTTGETFTLLTDPPDRNYVTVGAGVAAELGGGVVAFAGYQALLGYDNLDIHAVQAGVRVPFQPQGARFAVPSRHAGLARGRIALAQRQRVVSTLEARRGPRGPERAEPHRQGPAAGRQGGRP